MIPMLRCPALMAQTLFALLCSFACCQDRSTDFLPEEAFGAIILDTKALKGHPDSEFIPFEIISAFSRKHYGFDASEIETAVLVLSNDEKTSPTDPALGVIIRLQKAASIASILRKKDVNKEADALDVFYDQRYTQMYFAQVGPRTILASNTEADLMSMANSKSVTNSFTQLFTNAKSTRAIQILVSVEAIKPFLKDALAESPAPPPYEVFNTFPDQVQSMDLQFNVFGGIDLALNIKTYDEMSARKFENSIKHLLSSAKSAILTLIEPETDNQDPVQQATYKYAVRLGATLEQDLLPKREVDTLALEIRQNGVAATGMLIALLAPAIQATGDAANKAAAKRPPSRRVVASNRLKKVALACHQYHNAQRRFPKQAILDKKGKKLLSWRVEILPFLGYQDLYDKFRKDETWDSPHNFKLLDQMPVEFKNPNVSEPNKTNFLGVAGEGTIFDGSKSISFGNILDGSSNTIMFVEADQTVPWSKPEDYEVDWQSPKKNLGNVRPRQIVVGLADGTVRSIDNQIDSDSLKRIFRIDDSARQRNR